MKLVCLKNRLVGGHYLEPFAGGASVGLSLLFDEIAEVVHINDIDPGVFSFWTSVLHHTDAFCHRVEQVPLTVDEWHRQRAVYFESDDPVELGFATFFLNRTNRSGIIATAGVIGGQDQSGRWKIDARFNRTGLVSRIRRIADYRNRIRLHNLDALALLEKVAPGLPPKSLVYLDPPYFVKGKGLYPNFYESGDHAALAAAVLQLRPSWIVSYDNVPQICDLYPSRKIVYDLSYSAGTRYQGSEVVFFSDCLRIPKVESPGRIVDQAFRQLARNIHLATR
jgi:DNA adenine methylase